jgi:aryl-alcohol dehydrogenase-like predicted oxidoreductase
MEKRAFGRTGLSVSVLGLGCGAVGGLMVRGDPADQERAVARAMEAGINYLDTAAMYGNGRSEENLGRVLGKLKTAALVGTKVRLRDEEKRDIAGAVTVSLEASLRRLGRDYVDLFQLHNPITAQDEPGAVAADIVLNEVVPAFERLRDSGKTRFFGITATGQTEALHSVLESGVMHSAQVPYNLLNPSPGRAIAPDYPAQDYRDLLGRMQANGVAGIGIRILAGGALSGTVERHPIASLPPEPIGSARFYADDLRRAQRFRVLVSEGLAGSLAEASIRYVIAHPGMSTALIGVATPEQLEQAIAAVEKGVLGAGALEKATEVQRGLAGESR